MAVAHLNALSKSSRFVTWAFSFELVEDILKRHEGLGLDGRTSRSRGTPQVLPGPEDQSPHFSVHWHIVEHPH